MVRNIFLIVVLCASVETILFSQETIQSDPGPGKIAPALKNGKLESVRVRVKDSSAFFQFMKVQLPKAKIAAAYLPNVFRISVNGFSEVEKLAMSPAVEFIDRTNRIPKEEKALGAFDLTLNRIPAAQNLYSVNGEGLAASVKEKPFDKEDIDLRSPVIINDQFDELPTPHASSMATIIAGAGNSEPSGMGSAPAAEITTSDFLQLLPDDGNTLLNLGVSVQNHSYGVGVENYYGIESEAYDDHCNNFSGILHVFSSGNEGDKSGTGAYSAVPGFANLTGQFKISKNTLSVGSADVLGNVVVKSSRGPASDGRIKPEVSAFGDAGSSDAAAVVSGISLLVQQKYRDQVGALPQSSLVKAVLINSADDTGRPQVDFEAGFGNADALGAVRTIDQNHFFIGSVSENTEAVYNINVPANSHSLKVTLVWTDEAASPSATHALINDLDLRVRHGTSGEEWSPWVLSHYPHRDSLVMPAKRKADHLNNVEQVTLNVPSAGDYEVVVKGFNIPHGTQPFSIAYETESGFEWTNPTGATSFTANRNNFVRWRWSEPQALGKLEYKSIDDAEWILIGNSVDLSSPTFQWLTPDATLHVRLRMTIDNAVYESETFTIVQPIALKVGYSCDDEAMLVWTDVEGADQYQLFRMGDQYLEPFLVTADTFAILTAEDKDEVYYAVSPMLGATIGQKGTTIDYTNTGTACYFINFLPRQYVVTEDVIFDLTVGTTHNLQSVVFERLGTAVPIEIQKITPSGTNIVLNDGSPAPGSNQYRVRLENSSQETLYESEYEEIFYVRSQDLFVYPNPISPGELLNVLVDDLGTVRLRVYDTMGKLMEDFTDPGIIKTIDTTTLIKGAYIIEVLKTDGTRLTARLMVF